MSLNLIDRRNDRSVPDQKVKLLRIEVGYADAPQASFFHEVFEGGPDLSVVPHRPMDEHEIQIVQPHPLKGTFHVFLRPLVRRPGEAQFRGDENLVAGDAGFPDCRPHHRLVFIVLGGVQRTVSYAERIHYAPFRNGRIHQVHAVPDDGHVHAAVKFDRIHIHQVILISNSLRFENTPGPSMAFIFLLHDGPGPGTSVPGPCR